MDVLYERIKETRKMRGFTQEELALKVGYTGKSMISQIERGVINLPRTQILKFAEVLGVTPAYLMGFSETDENNPFRVQFEYLIGMWADLNKEGCDALIQYAELLSTNPKYRKMKGEIK